MSTEIESYRLASRQLLGPARPVIDTRHAIATSAGAGQLYQDESGPEITAPDRSR